MSISGLNSIDNTSSFKLRYACTVNGSVTKSATNPYCVPYSHYLPSVSKNVEGFSDKYDDLIVKYAHEYNLDPNLVKAMIKKESNFNPRVKSKSNIGLMQVSTMYSKNLYDPETNIKAGCKVLKHSLDAFNGDIEKALMGYNRGEGGARSRIQSGHSPKDDPYVKKVMEYYDMLTKNKHINVNA